MDELQPILMRIAAATGWQVGKILARDRSTISYAMSAYEGDYETDEMFRQIADRAKGNNII